MNFLEDGKEEHHTACVQAYKDAIDENIKVREVFKTKPNPNTVMMRSFSSLVYNFMHNKDLPQLKNKFAYDKVIGNFTYADIREAIKLYANGEHKEAVDLPWWTYNAYSMSSQMLVTLSAMRNNTTDQDLKRLIGDRVYNQIIAVQEHFEVPLLDKIRSLVVWYRNNRERIESCNRGTFRNSPLESIYEFIDSLTTDAIFDYSVYHVNSPAWFEWATMISTIYHVDIYCNSSVECGMVPEYEIKIVKPMDILKGVI